MSSLPTAKMKRRTNSFLLIAILLLALALIVNLFRISVIQNKDYQEKANQNQFGSITLSAHRGSIYDVNENVLAQSATVFKIFLDPKAYQENIKTFNDREEKKKASAEKKGEVYTPPEKTFEQAFEEFMIAKLGITKEDLDTAIAKNNRYVILKRQVEKPVADEIKVFKYTSDSEEEGYNGIGIKVTCIGIEEDTKRYYPFGTLAASVIGFTNSDGVGQYGLENQYNEYLSGIDGRVISAQNAHNEEMPYRYSKTYDPQDGDSLYLTLDMTLQHYLEKSLDETVKSHGVKERACGIIMNPKTGAILAMATSPSFDLNDPYTIYDDDKRAEVESIADKEQQKKAYIEARDIQWKNKAITETYYPGSVFKVFTSAAGFEENLIADDDLFNCTGEYLVNGVPIHCWHRSGHGPQTFIEAITNSCNPAFMEIGARLGSHLFSEYFKAFGLTERTGIDLPNETKSFYVSESKMGAVELASTSFGQTSKITPIEMITGYSAVINGGKLLTPYIVSKVVDSDGNIVKSNGTVVKRQVISEETSATMRYALEQVVEGNGGSNAYIKGYKIGGKSGTSQKQDKSNNLYVASYCGFAPADDPEIIVLVMADEPSGEDYYGGSVAQPVVRDVLNSALPYLGYYPEYTDEEIAKLEVTIPDLEDKTPQQARETLESLGLECEIHGEGTTVLDQVPSANSAMPRGGTVIIYTDDSEEKETVTVPNVTGMNFAQANETLAQYGLNYIADGASTDREDSLVMKQSYEEGTEVPKGTIVELTFVVYDQSG